MMDTNQLIDNLAAQRYNRRGTLAQREAYEYALKEHLFDFAAFAVQWVKNEECTPLEYQMLFPDYLDTLKTK